MGEPIADVGDAVTDDETPVADSRSRLREREKLRIRLDIAQRAAEVEAREKQAALESVALKKRAELDAAALAGTDARPPCRP